MYITTGYITIVYWVNYYWNIHTPVVIYIHSKYLYCSRNLISSNIASCNIHIPVVIHVHYNFAYQVIYN